MAQEIERKFLVKGNFKNLAHKQIKVVQGYLSSIPERSVRIRLKDDKGFITIKGKPGVSGASRYEWEKEIPVQEANELLQLCEPGIIDKIRHLVSYKNYIFEVDEFFGENEGLIIAEIELDTEEDDFPKPAWLGDEVTGDARYYNSMLINNPYSTWD
jgi:adenylate cyclase